MNKTRIRTKCQICNGKGCVPTDETFTIAGTTRVYHITCDACNGRGRETRWVDDRDVTRVLSVFKNATIEVSRD